MHTYLARISLAVFERASIVVAWHVPAATHDVVNMLAQRNTLTTFFTSPEAELGGRHEVLVGQGQRLSSQMDVCCSPSTRATAAAAHC
jgi:hypothetical protein